MGLTTLPVLRIGKLRISPPIIQGGMGVRVSGARLAAAVANEGCAGIIASVGLGKFEDSPGSRFVELNDEGLRQEIRKARGLSDGVIGVNIMVALSNYENLVRVAVDEKVDLIISGAGLPLELPSLVNTPEIALVPVVSSARALRIICRKWESRHNRLPDAVVLEGPLAGGHLGFKYDEVVRSGQLDLERLLIETVEQADMYDPPIPVIAAGGLFDGQDMVRVLEMGASGVQMSTRFVCTDECDVDDRFKEAYLNATEDDVTIINSPVGMPARVIRNDFVDRVLRGETMPIRCRYRCLRTCDPATAPYCIAKLLTDAARGDLENAFAFAGSNVSRCTEIVPVKVLIKQLLDEAHSCMPSGV